jgi:hypothetical protein
VGGCASLCPALYNLNVRRPGHYLAVHWQIPPVPVLAVVTPSALGSVVCGALPARGRERTRPGLGAREPAVAAWAQTRLVRSLGPPSLYKLLPGQRHPLQSGPCTHADVAKCAVEPERHKAFEARAQGAAAHTRFGHSLPHTNKSLPFGDFLGGGPGLRLPRATSAFDPLPSNCPLARIACSTLQGASVRGSGQGGAIMRDAWNRDHAMDDVPCLPLARPGLHQRFLVRPQGRLRRWPALRTPPLSIHVPG